MRTFVALQTFVSPETKSVYAEGLSYTIKPGNRYLNALAEVWVIEGKVAFAHQAKQEAQVSGGGILIHTFDPHDESIWEKTKKAWSALWQ